MANKVEMGVSGRIVARLNTGNYNHIEVELQGTKEEIAEEMDAYVDLAARLAKASRDKAREGCGVPPTEGENPTADKSEASTEEAPPPTSAPDEDTAARPEGVTLYTEKSPGPDKPTRARDKNGLEVNYKKKNSDEMMPLYACPNCQRHQTIYNKEYKGNKQYAFSCKRPPAQYGSELNCGYWTVWPVAEGLPK